MKRIYLFSALLCCVAVMVVFSCKKKTTEPTTYDVSHLNQLFSGLRSTPQNFTVQAGRDTILLGADSTVLHFYSNTFKDAGGSIITSGAITVQLIEMYRPGEMAANRTSTTANGQLLQSGGQVNIVATMNGKEVFANKYGLGFAQSSMSNISMQLFYGGNANSDSSTTWSIGDTSKKGTIATKTIRDTAHYKYQYPAQYYLFDSCTNFHWTNCDRFWRDSLSNTAVSVIFPDNSFDPSNTQIFLIFPTINSAVDMSPDFGNTYNPSTYTFKLAHGQAPIGMSYKLAVMTNKNGLYYYYETSGTVTDGLTINAAMASESLGDIKTRLHAL